MLNLLKTCVAILVEIIDWASQFVVPAVIIHLFGGPWWAGIAMGFILIELRQYRPKPHDDQT